MDISLSISPFNIYLFDHLNIISNIFSVIALISGGFCALMCLNYCYTLSSLDDEDITIETWLKGAYSHIDSINNYIHKTINDMSADNLKHLNFILDVDLEHITPNINNTKDLLKRANKYKTYVITSFLIHICSLTFCLLIPSTKEAYKYTIYSQLGSMDVSILQYYLDAIQVLINRL